jgi:choice-of-anchor A domain-containing protein
LNNQNLSQEISAAFAAASNAAAQTCTQTFATLNGSQTITGVAGLNVICISSVELNGGSIVNLNAPAGAQFILNITGKFALTGGSKIMASGGLKPQNVLYNIVGTGADVAFSGGGGGVGCCKTTVDGTLLAPERKIALSPGLVNGAIISGRDISIVSGASVRCPAPPAPAVNTITVKAKVGSFSGSACSSDIEGKPFSLTSHCSATVECRQ